MCKNKLLLTISPSTNESSKTAGGANNYTWSEVEQENERSDTPIIHTHTHTHPCFYYCCLSLGRYGSGVYSLCLSNYPVSVQEKLNLPRSHWFIKFDDLMYLQYDSARLSPEHEPEYMKSPVWPCCWAFNTK